MNVNNENMTIRDIDIPFGRLVVIMLKIMLAAIPAIILFYIICGIVFGIFAMIFGFGAASLGSY
tara:strand:- start:116 stop:307 length:192 start_codon:yes stop_codon:yes gene_type:complete